MTSTSQSGRYEVEDRIDEFRKNRANLSLCQIRSDKPDAAIGDNKAISNEVVSIRRRREIIHILIKVRHLLNAHNLVPHSPRLPQPLGSRTQKLVEGWEVEWYSWGSLDLAFHGAFEKIGADVFGLQMSGDLTLGCA